MPVTALDLIDGIYRKLHSYTQEGASTITVPAGAGNAVKFKLEHEHIVPGSITVLVTVADASTALSEGSTFTLDEDAGWLTLSTYYGEGAVITAAYQYRLFSEDDAVDALNNAVSWAWVYLPIRAIDTTMTSVQTTWSQALDPDIAYIERIYLGPNEPYARQYDWEVTEDWDETNDVAVRNLKWLAVPGSGPLRIKYIRACADLDLVVDETDGAKELQRDAHVSDKAKDAIVLQAAYTLLQNQVIVRMSEVAFLNADQPNVPRVSDAMRVAEGLRVGAQMEIDSARSTPRLRQL